MANKPALDGHRTPLRAEIRATLALALPLILGNLAGTAINTIDVIVLGRYNVDALATAALALNVYFAVAVFAMGLVTAASPLIAAERGRRGHSVRDIRRTVRQALWSSFFVCIPIWIILWNSGAILLLLGQDATLSADAETFSRIAMWGLFPFLVHIVLRYYVTALERPIWGLIVTSCGVAFNAVVCWALVFGELGLPELGLIGAAVAHFLSQCVLMIGMILVVSGVKPFRRYHLFGHLFRADWARFREINRLGLPIAVTLVLEVAVFAAAVFLMGLIGRDSLAAHAVAIQIASLAFMLPLGLSQAATVRVGIFYGRKDPAGVALAGKVSFLIGIGAAVLLSTIMILIPGRLVGLFVDATTPEGLHVFGLAVTFVIVAAAFQLADGVQAVGAGVLRGLQDTRWPMFIAAFGYWVVGLGIAIWLGFPQGLEGLGIWIGLAAGLAVVAVMMVTRWSLRERIGLVPDGQA